MLIKRQHPSSEITSWCLYYRSTLKIKADTLSLLSSSQGKISTWFTKRMCAKLKRACRRGNLTFWFSQNLNWIILPINTHIVSYTIYWFGEFIPPVQVWPSHHYHPPTAPTSCPAEVPQQTEGYFQSRVTGTDWCSRRTGCTLKPFYRQV